MTSSHFFTALLCIVFFIFGTFASAETSRLDMLSSNVPYFSQVYPDNSHAEPQGFSIMLAKAIAEDADIELTIHSVPWAKLIRDVHSRQHILATGVVRTPEREEQFYWITPITYNPIGLYGKSRASDLNTWQNIQSVSVLRGDYREDIVRRHKLPTVMSTNNWEQAIKAVLKGRVDAVFYSGFGIQMTCQNGGLICEKIALIQIERTAVSYIAISKKPENAAVAKRLQQAARRVTQSPEFNAKVLDWLQENALLQDNSSYAGGAIVFNGAVLK